VMSIEGMGYPLFYARRYDEALGWYKKALEVDPNFALAYNDMALVYARKDMYKESVEASLKAAALSEPVPSRSLSAWSSFKRTGTPPTVAISWRECWNARGRDRMFHRSPSPESSSFWAKRPMRWLGWRRRWRSTPSRFSG